MHSVFDHTDYRQYLDSWMDSHDRKRGLRAQLAEAAKISPTMLTLIMKGEKNLSQEQALELCEFIGLGEKESEHFFLLVDLARAGTTKLKQKIQQRLQASQKAAQKVEARVRQDLELSEQIKSIYYSSWTYTGIRNLAATEKFKNAKELAQHLNLPVSGVAKVVEFLLENKLCLEKNGRLSYGPTYTHLSTDSQHVNKQHQNWRIRGFTMMEQRRDSDFFYTCPMSLSHDAANEIRKLLPTFVEQVLKTISPRACEEVKCLNIDWFEY